MSLTKTLTINSVHLAFAGVINLICLSWLVDMLHFLPCYFSFLDCSETMPVSSVEPAATYTQFTKWCSRATLTRRSRLHQELADVRCQSYNVVMFIAICALNNRTKEARPEDFVTNKDRYYMAKGPKRGDRKCKDLKAVLQLRRGGRGRGEGR